jgi:methanogenic corrinoid protein MtbC1
MQSGTPANAVYTSLIWPIMVELENLSRADRITSAQEHIAARLNRTIVDQLQNKLPRKSTRNKRIVVCCAEAELQELGAQIIADLFESDGWEVKFLGGGLTNEDILTFSGEFAPDILLIYGSTPQQAPSMRKLIDTIKDVNAHPNMRIMLSGGVFARADGLWQEIGADLFASDAIEAVQLASTEPSANPDDLRTLNRRKRKHKKELAQAAV